VKPTELVVLTRCLHCGHRSILSHQVLARFGLKSDSPIASFVKWLRCSKCGSGSVMANRVARNERTARRQMQG
jgi:ribosomal protein S27AE